MEITYTNTRLSSRIIVILYWRTGLLIGNLYQNQFSRANFWKCSNSTLLNSSLWFSNTKISCVICLQRNVCKCKLRIMHSMNVLGHICYLVLSYPLLLILLLYIWGSNVRYVWAETRNSEGARREYILLCIEYGNGLRSLYL